MMRTGVETLGCGCEWEIDITESVARCLSACRHHREKLGEYQALAKPLPPAMTFADWLSAHAY